MCGDCRLRAAAPAAAATPAAGLPVGAGSLGSSLARLAAATQRFGPAGAGIRRLPGGVAACLPALIGLSIYITLSIRIYVVGAVG